MRRYYAAQMQTQREKFAREIAARAHALHALQGSLRAHARTDRLKKAHLAKKLHRVIDRRAKMKTSPYRPVELPGHRMEQ
jgi:two-component sensor histidine kinase